MKHKPYSWLFCGCYKFLMLAQLISSESSCMAAKPNLRLFYRDNMSAIGSLLSSNEAQFYSITIGTPASPLDGKCNFSIRVKDRVVLRPANLTRENIEAVATRIAPLKKKSGWGKGAIEYSVEGYVFVFSGTRCVSFRATWVQLPNKTLASEIGTGEENVFFRMPLTQEQVEIIFGKADRVDDKTVL